jgi:nicotinate-nucleotide--dimethylbenzimidazole phosphoribosyltransferase
MGIGNTTASSAILAAIAGCPVREITGRGTGVDDATLQRKIDAVRAGLGVNDVTPALAVQDPLRVLAAVGGLEHAALAGFVLGGAARRVPVVLDGVIAAAAALVAVALAPASIDACLAGHRSAEPGHAIALRALGLRPLVDLDLRLGEGTGAVLAMPLIRAAARALRDMATFDSAGVVDKTADADSAG